MLYVLGAGTAATALAACAPAAPKPAAEAKPAEGEQPKPTEAPAKAAPKVITYVDSAGFGSPPYKESQDPSPRR